MTNLEMLSGVRDAWATGMTRASWQGGLAIILAALVCRCCPRISPTIRSWMWRLVFLKLVISLAWLPPVELPVLRPERAAVAVTVAAPAVAAVENAVDLDFSPPAPDRQRLAPVKPLETNNTPFVAQREPVHYTAWLLFGAWLVGATAAAVWIAIQRSLARRSVGRLVPITDPSACAILNDLAAKLAIRPLPSLATSETIPGPAIWGLLRPSIVIPRALFEDFEPARIEMLLAHELWHARRRDLWWNWLRMIANILFWFHPLVWLANREWYLAQESACDEGALAVTGRSAAAYGAFLLDAVSIASLRGRLLQPGIGAGVSFRVLQQRLIAMHSFRPLGHRQIFLACAILLTVGIASIVPWRLVASRALADEPRQGDRLTQAAGVEKYGEAFSKKGTPTPTPLADAVAAFNESVKTHDFAAGDLSIRQPAVPEAKRPTPLTADEAVAAIRNWDRKTFPINDATYRIFEEIAKTRTLPPHARLYFRDEWGTGRKPGEQVKDENRWWFIQLDIVTGKNTGYGFWIRKQVLDRRLALLARPLYHWIWGPAPRETLGGVERRVDAAGNVTFVPVPLVKQSTGYSAGGVVFSIEQGSQDALLVTTARKVEQVGELHVVAFDRQGKRFDLQSRGGGSHEDLKLENFRLDPAELSWDDVQFLGMEAVDPRENRPGPPAAAVGEVSQDQSASDANRGEPTGKPVAPSSAPAANPTKAVEVQRTIRGTVLDENEAPIEGARVFMDWVQGGHAEILSDSKGRFELAAPPMRLGALLVRASTDEGQRQAAFSIPFDANPAGINDVELKLSPARRVELHVADAAGQPVAGATAGVLGSAECLATIPTDAAGKAVLLVPRDLKIACVYALKDGQGLDYRAYLVPIPTVGDQKAVAPKLPDGPVQLTLDGASPLRVRAVTTDDTPIAGANVHPWYVRKPDQPYQLHLGILNFGETRLPPTDADGMATFDWMPRWQVEPLTVWAAGEGYVSQRSVYNPKTGDGKLTIQFQRPVPIRGQVTLPNGSPAAGINVVASGAGYDVDDFHATATTDALGRYEIKAAPNKIYLVVVEDKKWAAEPRTGFAVWPDTPVEDVDFKLRLVAKVFGRVTLGTDQHPVEGEQIYLYQYGAGPHEINLNLPNPEHSRRAVIPYIGKGASTDENGNFEFLVGPGKFSIRGPGEQNPAEEFEITDDREKEFNFHAARPAKGILKGRVVAGEPPQGVAGALLLGIDRTTPAETDMGVTTDAEGKFEVERELVRTAVHARSQDGTLAGVAEIGPDDTTLTLALRPVATASGRLIDAKGQPLRGRDIEYWVKVGPWRGTFGGKTTTDELGRFQCKGLVLDQLYDVTLVIPGEGNPANNTWHSLTKVRPRQAQENLLGDLKLRAPGNPPAVQAAAKPAKRQRPDTPVGHLLDKLERLNASNKPFGEELFAEPWLRTLRAIADLGPEAVPELVAELDATDDNIMLRCCGFTLRAIGDRRAVPALIRAIPRTLVGPGSDMGLQADDADLLAWAQSNDLNAPNQDRLYYFGRPVREIFGALNQLTNQHLGEEGLSYVTLGGSASQGQMKRQLYDRVARQWADWWDKHSQEYVQDPQYMRVDLPPPAAEAAHAPLAEAHYKTAGGMGGCVLEPVLQLKAIQTFRDLDTGRVVGLPEKWQKANNAEPPLDEIIAWAKSEGFDLMGTRYTAPDGQSHYALRGIDLQAWELGPERWKMKSADVTVEDLKAEGRPTEGMLLHFDQPSQSIEPEAVASFLYVTREGTPGLLFVGVEVTDDRVQLGVRPAIEERELDPVAFRKGRRFAYSEFEEVK